MLFKNIHISVFVLFMLCSSIAISQTKTTKADKHFELFEYSYAIPHYEKALGDSKDTSIMRKLGKCYIETNDYKKAEGIYKYLVEVQPKNERFHYYYAESLKNNYKFLEAKDEYLLYSKINPNDRKVNEYITACDKILDHKDYMVGVELVNAKNINTKYSEFNAFPYKDGIIFSSDRKINFYENENQGWTNRPYYSIFKSSFNSKDSTFTKIDILHGKVYNDYHNGPACLNPATGEIYFTRITKGEVKHEHGKSFVNRAKIYSINLDKEEEIKPFPYNSDSYSVAHPFITKSGSLMFFTSDMPGGYGGQDIYYSMRTSSGWSKPVNLGPEVNTKGDEAFPFAKNEKSLYFSSNGHIGFGGYDIFSTTNINGKWTLVFNMKDPINTGKDDLTIYFNDNNNGYMASNRDGGKGNDDIYFFAIHRRNISGMLFSEKDSVSKKNLKVKLECSKTGVCDDSTFTDQNGNFSFKNLDPSKSYNLLLEEDEDGYMGYMINTFYKKNDRILVYIASKKGAIIDSLHLESAEFFHYQNLDMDHSKPANDTLFDINFKIDNTPIAIEGKLHAKIESKLLAQSNQAVYLKNSEGTIIDLIKTDNQGRFEFRNLPNNGDYMISLDETDPNLNLYNLYVLSGKIYHPRDPGKLPADVKLFYGGSGNNVLIKRFIGGDNSYIFEILPKEFYKLSAISAEDVAPIIDKNITVCIDGRVTYGENVPANAYRVYLKTQKGDKILAETITDRFGKFKFSKLPKDQAYTLLLNEEDIDLVANMLHTIAGEAYFQNIQKTPAYNIELFFGGTKKKEIIKYFDGIKSSYSFGMLPSDFYEIPKLTLEDTRMLFKDETLAVEGRLTYGKEIVAQGYKVFLKDSEGTLVKEVFTDNFGKFKFSKLLQAKKYSIELDPEDLNANAREEHQLTGEAYLENEQKTPAFDLELYFAGAKKKDLLKYFDGVKSNYSFKFLPGDYYNLKSLEEEDTKLAIEKTIAIAGRITYGKDIPAKHYKIYLRTKDGKPVTETTSDEFGKFRFKSLPPKESYAIAIDEKNLDLEKNEEHRVIGEAFYEDDSKTPAYDIELFFAGIKKKKIIKYFDGVKSNYSFSFLPKEFYGLDNLSEEDTWLDIEKEATSGQKTSFITQNINYSYNGWDLHEEEFKELDKLVEFLNNNPTVRLEVHSHTDSRGTDSYNLALSEKRAKSVTDYLVSKGVKSNRLSSFGFGEQRLLNECKNDYLCTEEQHAQNRRTEFKIVWKN